jgi:hypothetical protein
MRLKENIVMLMCISLLLTDCAHDDECYGNFSDISVQFTTSNLGTRASSLGWHEMNVPLNGDTSTSSPVASTRGSVVGDTGAPVGSFGVLGYVLPNGTWSSSLTPSFLYDTQVTRQGTNSNYTYRYSPYKYWPNNTSNLVKFFAYYPYGGNGISLSSSTATGYPSLTYAPSTTVSDQVDLMYASSSACNNKSTDNAVSLSFNHALTRISFSVESNSSYVFTVQSISLTGIKSKGTLSYDPSVASSPWTLSSLSTDTTTYTASTSDDTLLPETSQSLSSSAYQNVTSYTGNLLLLPQSVTSANKLVVRYMVNGASTVSTIALPSATWTMGQSLNYQVKLGLPSSNSYIVTPFSNSTFTLNIPITRVNDFWGNTSYGNDPTYMIGSNDVWTANIIWQDGSSSVSLTKGIGVGASGNITVKVAAGSASGNTIIGIKKAGTTGYAWSWHVWVTGYDPNLKNSKIGNYTFMDYNLGTTSITPGEAYKGLYYQWGRKDPFPQASSISSNYQESISGSSITNTAVTVANNLANSVLNPATFYFNSSGVSDWYTNSGSTSAQNNYLWGITKTINDPCPPGWKVAPDAAYYPTYFSNSTMTYSDDNYGWTDNGSGSFWPLTGFMYSGTGAMGSVGSHSSYWTSIYYSAGAYIGSYLFNMYTTYVVCTFGYSRAMGFPVRCVQDK